MLAASQLVNTTLCWIGRSWTHPTPEKSVEDGLSLSKRPHVGDSIRGSSPMPHSRLAARLESLSS